MLSNKVVVRVAVATDQSNMDMDCTVTQLLLPAHSLVCIFFLMPSCQDEVSPE